MRVLSWNHGERRSQNCSGRQWGLGDFSLEVFQLRLGDRGDPNPVTRWSGAAASYSVSRQTTTLNPTTYTVRASQVQELTEELALGEQAGKGVADVVSRCPLSR